jgi:predicted nucleic acid-binding protein
MILVDTSVWIDHIRRPSQRLAGLIAANGVVVHPFVIGELAMGNLSERGQFLRDLSDLPAIEVAMDHEVIRYVDAHRLYGIGIGYIDVHLLTAVRLMPGARFWTRDQRLAAAAQRLGLAVDFTDFDNQMT